MSNRAVLLVAGMVCVGSAARADEMKHAKKPAMSDAQLMKAAATAAPPEIGKDATYAAVDESMKMRQLKAGTNGWVCMAMEMGAKPDVMCMDKAWQAWGEAYMTKKDPPPTQVVGVAYMLAGDQGASNTDPYAMGPTADNQWVVSGPHLMLLMPDAKALDAYPTDPKTGGPWVMWKGTKYAHVMVPVAAMPKQPAPPKGK
jgi:hypothetical protein